MHLASRYRKQQSMIGATMFPIYWKVLKASLGLAFLVLVAASIATAAAGKTLMESLGVLFRYPSVALMTFAWITLAFSALEFFGARLRLKDNWDPRKLPPLVKHSPRKSSFELITQLLLQTIFGVWWLAGLHYQYLIFGPGIAFLHFAPVWQSIYPLFVVMVLVDVAITAGMLIWPQWAQGKSVSRLVMSALGLVVLYFLINAPELFVARRHQRGATASPGERHQQRRPRGADDCRHRERGQHRGGICTAYRAEAWPGASGDGVFLIYELSDLRIVGVVMLEEHRRVDHRNGQRSEDAAQSAFRVTSKVTTD